MARLRLEKHNVESSKTSDRLVHKTLHEAVRAGMVVRPQLSENAVLTAVHDALGERWPGKYSVTGGVEGSYFAVTLWLRASGAWVLGRRWPLAGWAPSA